MPVTRVSKNGKKGRQIGLTNGRTNEQTNGRKPDGGAERIRFQICKAKPLDFVKTIRRLYTIIHLPPTVTQHTIHDSRGTGSLPAPFLT